MRSLPLDFCRRSLICRTLNSLTPPPSSCFVPKMREPPYDRAFALAAQVLAMRDHYLEVRCGCGARRVIGLGRMAEHLKTRTLTLATVAARLRCAGCFTGPDEVHLTATVYGLQPPEFGGDTVWSIPLRGRERRPSYYLRRVVDAEGGGVGEGR